MNLREGILDALADDAESIVQIKGYLEYLKIIASDNEIVTEISKLLEQQKIVIVYPYDKKGTINLDIANIEDYWFDLTQEGRNEQQAIKI